MGPNWRRKQSGGTWVSALGFHNVAGGMDASLIAAYLDNVATESMGVDSNPGHSSRVAELLLEWKTEVYRIWRQQT